MGQYTEGQRLQGSDGQVYVVHGGVPVLESTAPRPRGQIFSLPADSVTSQLQQAELTSRQAQAQNAPAIQSADARIKNAQAAEIERKNAEAAADDAAARIRPTGKLTIDQLPASARPIVSAMLQGNLPVGARSVTSPQMLPYLQMAINVDPNFSAATFPARAAAMKQLADMKSTGGYLTSLAANIDHSREEEAAVNRLNNPGGFVGRWGGAAAHNWLVNEGGPAGAQFSQANRVYAGEQVKSITGNVGSAGGGSALADRQDAERAISASMPIDAQRAALRVGATQNYQKYRDADQGFMRTMGTHIPSPLSQEQAAQLLHLMRLQEDGTEGPIPKDVDPAFVALAQGPSKPSGPRGGAGGGGTGGNDPYHFDPNDAGGGSGGQGVATDTYRDVYNRQVSIMTDRLIRQGKSAAQISAALGPGRSVSQKAVTDAQNYLAAHPGYKGLLGEDVDKVPTTWFERASASAPSAAAMGAYNGVTAGFSDEIAGGLNYLGGGNYTEARDAYDAKKKALAQLHPYADVAGNVAGGMLAMAAPTAGLARLGLGASKILAPGALALDTGYGALYGAGENNDNRVGGAVAGGIGGLVGGVGGRAIAAPVAAAFRSAPAQGMFANVGNAYRGFRGQDLLPVAPPPAPLAAGDATILSTAQRAGLPNIMGQLTEAQRLGVPMSLADTHPNMTSLAGGAVRRSPNAEAIAQDAFLPRSRGQIDRLGTAVQRDLGPVGNIPQISADMTARARAAAGPLYDRAYAAPVTSTPELDATLNTPFGRDALGRARTIAANERRSPTELGFAQDARGNTILNPQPNQAIANHLAARAELDAAQDAYRAARNGPGDVTAAQIRVAMARDNLRRAEQGLTAAPDPSTPASIPGYTTQTLDYVKRGMDDVLEQHRNPITGRLQLDEAGRAQNQVKNQFLGEVDRLNPDYAAARSAYAGPVQSRDAMALGQDAFSANPDELGIQVANQTPEHLGQMQLGYRSALMDRANAGRFSSNPFDATLGTPNAEQRLGTLYPNNPGVPNLLAQRDLESSLARSTNDVLGNSKTAQRGIADKAFQMAALPSLGIDAGLMSMGHPPLATAGLIGAKGITAAVQRALESRAVSRADAIAPTLFNTDPAVAASSLTDFVNQSQLYRDYVEQSRQRVGTPAGMFAGKLGAQVGSQLAF